jgi:predicted DCC family thiol-disulfide oxidoreductase YuxK
MMMRGPMKIYYDGGCPICSREIAFYKARPGADNFIWVDVSSAGPTDLGEGLTREQAMARMHVREADGTLLSGAEAFGAMWRQMPGFKGLGWLLVMPPFGAIAEFGYRIFLVFRKSWR